MNLTYKKANIADATRLIEIYNAAFYDDYIRYGECPGYGKQKKRWNILFQNPLYI